MPAARDQGRAPYRRLRELVDRIETIEAVRARLQQVEQGQALPLEELDRRLSRQHGICGLGHRDRRCRDRQCLRMDQERAPDAAERWFNGRQERLAADPRRCVRVLAAEFEGSEIRQLVCGRRRGRYRVLFTIHGDTVEIARALHGARAAGRR